MKMLPFKTYRPWIVKNMMTLATVALILAYGLFVQWAWGWRDIIALWAQVGSGTAILALGLLVSTYFLRTWRFADYFPNETRGRFATLFRLTQIHNILNIMLPFRSGETSFPLLMRKEFSVPLARGTAALLVMRLFDLHALLAAAGVGLAPRYGALGWLAWALFLVAPAVAFAARAPLFAGLSRLLPARLSGVLEGLKAGLPHDARAFARSWCATLVNWFVKIAILTWVLVLMGGIPLGAGFGGALGGELSSVLPVHAPAGVGTYPAGISAGAVAFGAPASRDALQALAKAAVNVHLLITVSALLGAALALMLPARPHG